MEFTFGASDTFSHCKTKGCGVGQIRHHLAQAEYGGKQYVAKQCSRCKRLTVEVTKGEEEE